MSRANSSVHTELLLVDMLLAIGLKMVAAENLNLVAVAALVGDTARATMLGSLMGGRSLAATELVYRTNIFRATVRNDLRQISSSVAVRPGAPERARA